MAHAAVLRLETARKRWGRVWKGTAFSNYYIPKCSPSSFTISGSLHPLGSDCLHEILFNFPSTKMRHLLPQGMALSPLRKCKLSQQPFVLGRYVRSYSATGGTDVRAILIRQGVQPQWLIVGFAASSHLYRRKRPAYQRNPEKGSPSPIVHCHNLYTDGAQ
jgi:hypothetical protein